MIVLSVLAMQAAAPPPIVLAPVRNEPVALPELPWRNQSYSLRCEVLDATLRQASFALTLTNDGIDWVSISGDDHHGLNTNGLVTAGSSPSLPDGNIMLRHLNFEGANGAWVQITQAFEDGMLQSTSFMARHDHGSDGIANTQQVLGFCVQTGTEGEASQ